MSIVLLGSTSGSITLQEPAVSGNTVLSLPATSGTLITTGSTGQVIPKAALPTGSVLQVVQSTLSGQGSTTSTSFVDTGLSVSITPTSSSSKIMVVVNLNGCLTLANQMLVDLLRGSTSICKFGEAGLNGATNRNDFGDFSVSFLDSPATTSSTTYKVQARSAGGSTVYWCNQTNNSISTITAWEIAA